MACAGKEKKGYNVYQARLYTITDELAIKHSFIDQEEARQFLFDFIQDEKNGPLFARAIIRCIDPVLKSWIVPWGIDNPKALLLDEDQAVIDHWRVTFYDMGDFVILKKESNEPIDEKMIQLLMMTNNAFYAVVSCQEVGNVGRFIISRKYLNKAFNLSVMDYDEKRVLKQQQEPLEECYKKLLDLDMDETKRINTERAK